MVFEINGTKLAALKLMQPNTNSAHVSVKGLKSCVRLHMCERRKTYEVLSESSPTRPKRELA
jgi:hypothetical protein